MGARAGRRTTVAVAALVALLLSPTAAEAAWTKVETDRFVVYGEGREAAVRDYAIKLTTFDKVLRLLNPGTRERPPARKMEVYLVRGVSGLRRIDPNLGAGVRGFYAATPEGVFAAVSEASDLGGDEVLFHEYAHHFMLENYPAAYPGWFVEGWAEYYMTTRITPKTVKVGDYNANRVYWLFNAPWVPMEDVLAKSMRDIRKERRHLYYSQAWLLMHYMRASPERAAQLNAATQAIARGEEPLKAFKDATGMDTPQLTSALRKYRRLPTITFENPVKTPPPMTVTTLTPAAAEFLLDDLRLAANGLTRPDPAFLADIRARAARYPGDRTAELTLARAEHLHGDVAAGDAILERRLAAEPQDVELLRLTGLGHLVAGERDPARRLERFRAARTPLSRAYRLDDRDYRILYAFAISRMVEPNFPTENDVAALMEARAMAPAVQPTSILAGAALLRRGERERAQKVLAPILNNPHGGPMPAQARALLEGKSLTEAAAEGAAAEAEPPIGPEPGQPTEPTSR